LGREFDEGGGVDHAARADTGTPADDSHIGDVLAAPSFQCEQATKVRARQMIANCEVSAIASNFSPLHRAARHDRKRFSDLGSSVKAA
jgi:hypothetical protein